MRTLSVLALALVLAGCGDDSESMEGAWTLPEGTIGGVALTLSGDHYVSLDISLGRRYYVSMERGTFTATADQITFTPEEWTCEGTEAPHTSEYTLSDGRLLLAVETEGGGFAPAGTLHFARRAAALDPADPVYGCFTENVFAAHPIVPAR